MSHTYAEYTKRLRGLELRPTTERDEFGNYILRVNAAMQFCGQTGALIGKRTTEKVASKDVPEMQRPEPIEDMLDELEEDTKPTLREPETTAELEAHAAFIDLMSRERMGRAEALERLSEGRVTLRQLVGSLWMGPKEEKIKQITMNTLCDSEKGSVTFVTNSGHYLHMVRCSTFNSGKLEVSVAMTQFSDSRYAIDHPRVVERPYTMHKSIAEHEGQ